MRLPPLTPARLLRRYKRFLADVELDHGKRATVHVPNTGSLLGCIEPGCEVWLRELDAGCKYRYGLMLVRAGKSLVCVDTGLPNRIVVEAARASRIPQLAGYSEYIPEMPLGESSRVDLVCRVHADDMLRRCWVEIKATTLAVDGCAQFPDAVTTRGRRHLIELKQRVQAGERAAQVFFIQRSDCERFRPAEDIDPQYAAELRDAAAEGVEVVALLGRVTKREVGFDRLVPVEL